MANTDLQLPVNNELYAEKEIEATEGDNDETADDPRRGAKTIGNDWTYSSNISICSEIISTKSQGSDKDEINKDIDVDEIKPSNRDVDDPGKETIAPEYDVIYPSNNSQGNKIFKTENEVYDSTTTRAAGADEKARTSIDFQRSEIMREKESHEKTVAHHTLNKMTNKETIRIESKFMIAEIA